MVMKGLIFNNFHFGRVWWSSNNLSLTVDTFGVVWWSLNDRLLTIDTLGSCGRLERTHF